MWKFHLMICAALIILVLPVYFFDQYLLKPMGSGPGLAIDFRGVVVGFYVLVAAIHMLLSSGVLYLVKSAGLLKTHVATGVISIILVLGGLYGVTAVNEYLKDAERDLKLQTRDNYFDIIELEKWWYAPDASDPDAVHVVLSVSHAGRFAVSIEGRSGGRNNQQIFVGEMDQQIWIPKGDQFEVILKVTRYNPGIAKEIQIKTYLFKDEKGTAPEDILKVFLRKPARKDDGRTFFGKLPPAMQ